MRKALAAVLAIALGGALTGGALAGECEAAAPPQWREIAPGVSAASMNPGIARISELVLFRLNPSVFQTRVFDMRDIAEQQRRKGIYTPPLYSISELLGTLPTAFMAVSAGFTHSLTNPAPAGFLKTGSRAVGRVATKDPILDAVVCVDGSGRVGIHSDAAEGRHRAPTPPATCTEGFQAGPLLVSREKQVATANRIEAARVFLAVDAQQRLIVGRTPLATPGGLACVLAARHLEIVDAVSVQGAEIGGFAFGSAATETGLKAFGNVDSTIASALILERRAARPDPREAARIQQQQLQQQQLQPRSLRHQQQR